METANGVVMTTLSSMLFAGARIDDRIYASKRTNDHHRHNSAHSTVKSHKTTVSNNMDAVVPH